MDRPERSPPNSHRRSFPPSYSLMTGYSRFPSDQGLGCNREYSIDPPLNMFGKQRGFLRLSYCRDRFPPPGKRAAATPPREYSLSERMYDTSTAAVNVPSNSACRHFRTGLPLRLPDNTPNLHQISSPPCGGLHLSTMHD